MSEINRRASLYSTSAGALQRKALAQPSTTAKPSHIESVPAPQFDAPLVGRPEDAPPSHLSLILIYFGIAFSAQLLLLIPQFSGLRVPLRVAPFGTSLLLALFPLTQSDSKFRKHPALPFAMVILAIVSIGLLNQYTSSPTAGIAQICFTAAILSPLLWVGRLKIGSRGLATIVLCIWVFSAMSSGVGVLQVMYPGRFQPATSSIVQGAEDEGIVMNIQLADGTETMRPYGLTDQPGGAAAAGLTAFVFGLGLLVASKRMYMRVLYLAGMGIGLFIMYLSQVRASIVMCGIATIAFAAIMSLRGEFARLTGSLAALAVVVFVSTSAAFVVGGDSTRDRLLTLTDDNAASVYQSNRGMFLDYTFEYVLPNYPMGAGLGRYGMMSLYFNKTTDSQSLWAEIQWTAWAYDGGWLMVIAYPLAILVAVWMTFKIGKDRKYGPVGLWAAILTCYNISVVAVLFSYSFFLSQGGLEFWLLNAACFSAAQVYLRSLSPDVPEGFEVIPAPWKPEIASGSASSAATPQSGSRRRPLGQRPRPAIVPIFDSPEPANGDA